MSRPLARILIADGFDAVRRGVRLLVEAEDRFHVIGEACTGPAALHMIKDTQPTVAIIEYGLTHVSGGELIARIRSCSPRTEVLIYTDINRESAILEALRAGAKGFVLKDDPESELIAAVDSLAVGRRFISKQISQIVCDRSASLSSLSESCLSNRERQIVQMVAGGLLNRHISDNLNVSVKTVETHRSNAMRKLNLRTTADLARYAIRNELIQP